MAKINLLCQCTITENARQNTILQLFILNGICGLIVVSPHPSNKDVLPVAEFQEKFLTC